MIDEKIEAPRHLISRMRELRCKHCGRLCWFSDHRQNESWWGWDSEFCKACDRWTFEKDGVCGGLGCNYCTDKPARPSQTTLEPFYTWQYRCLDEEEAVAVSPLPGKEGQAGAALVGLEFG